LKDAFDFASGSGNGTFGGTVTAGPVRPVKLSMMMTAFIVHKSFLLRLLASALNSLGIVVWGSETGEGQKPGGAHFHS
jgi:hypothetical protein